MSDTPTFPDADFYDCRDSERFSHTTPEDAVEDLFDVLYERGDDIVQTVRDHGPVTVSAYRPRPLDVAAVALRIMDDVAQGFDDEYGDEEDVDLLSGIDKAEQEAILAMFRDAVAKMYAHGRVFQCERVGRTVLTAEQVEALLREHRPDWFESTVIVSDSLRGGK